MGIVGRLAPTPSGDLHLGNICAFAAAYLSVRHGRGRLLYRNEDVDTERSRPRIAARQQEDLRWLGIAWDEEVTPQASRDYLPWLQKISDSTYHCSCTRKDIRENRGVHPKDCREKGHQEGALRFALPPGELVFIDRRFGKKVVSLSDFDDPVLRRRDGMWSYNMAVVVDDIADGVTEVVRGADLLDHTAVQIALWQAFGTRPPTWLHGPMIVGVDGRKLSKSHADLEVRALRDNGWTPQRVWANVLPWLGLAGDDLQAAIEAFDPAKFMVGPIMCVFRPDPNF